MKAAGIVAVIAATLALAPAGAQVRTIDPNHPGPAANGPASPSAEPASPATAETAVDSTADVPAPRPAAAPAYAAPPSAAASPAGAPADDRSADPARRKAAAVAANDTYAEKDVLDAAEGVFGKGASGLAKLIEDIFRKQGRPTAYIAGREAGGAVIAGVRYGSGTLFHKIEGQRPVYWAGPSLGIDLGAHGAKTFVLVYNLYDTQELYKRFPAAEGDVYVVGGFTASYLRWGKVVVIPIRLGVGWRLGANVGYMRFSEKSSWSPF